MLFKESNLKGTYLLELEKKEDARGFLARTWDAAKFRENGINFVIEEGYITRSLKKGTIRGFHYLKTAEQKLTRVLKGSVFEVVIDVRPESKTYGSFFALTLKDSDYKMLYMGPGTAHAILALEDNTELMSMYSPAYAPGSEGGIRYNDPAFNIPWPIPISNVSEKDMKWEDFKKIL